MIEVIGWLLIVIFAIVGVVGAVGVGFALAIWAVNQVMGE